MKFIGKNNEYIEIVDLDTSNQTLLSASKPSELSLVWFKGKGNAITIDAVNHVFNANDIISLTEFHKIDVNQLVGATLIRWNRSFYCVVDHDSEVSCKGILYYGASTVPVIKPDKKNSKTLTTVIEMLLVEMGFRDNLQLEMLQMILKRLLIVCTRIYKEQYVETALRKRSIDVIREYNYLVERHFKAKHSVSEYAELLYKSPKTLSNLFKKYGDITPLQYIQNRIMLEARRLLTYTQQPVSAISDQLGFSDVQTFSRFFSKQEGHSPQKFRNREILLTR